MRIVGLALVSLAMLAPPVAAEEFHEVVVHDFRYDPPGLSIAVGDVVTWSRSPEAVAFHNVREDRGLFTSGAPSATPGWTYVALFSAGTFRYACEVHGDSADMRGVVRVPPTIDPVPGGDPFTVRWSAKDATTGETFDVRYRARGGKWERWLNDTGAKRRVFGKGNRPEPVLARVYEFRVRSRRGDAVGRWSPVEAFRP